MLISELIGKLIEQKERYGDLEVYSYPYDEWAPSPVTESLYIGKKKEETEEEEKDFPCFLLNCD